MSMSLGGRNSEILLIPLSAFSFSILLTRQEQFRSTKKEVEGERGSEENQRELKKIIIIKGHSLPAFLSCQHCAISLPPATC